MFRRLFAFASASVIVLLSAQAALAARVYNYLPVPVHVQGLTARITVQPGKRSESISWPTTNSIGIFVTDRMLSPCGLMHFGPHAEMVAGHYLVIGHDGLEVSCTLCDSDHNVMHHTSGRAPQEIAKELRGRNSDTSC